MAVVRNLLVRAGADFSGLYKEMKTANNRMSSFGKNFKSAIKGGIIAGAASVAGAYMKSAIQQASDLSESVSAVGQVFGDSYGEIERYAKTSATSLGQTRQQVYDAAKTFGIFGNAAGLSSKENAKFSTSLVGLATDMASFNNTSVSEAIDAISSGLRGENEPLRRYGVLLDDATMRQAALKMGIINTTSQALTPQQKILAANALIWQQTATQQGDFARTSSGLANQQRILSAQFAEIKVTLGEAFLPIVTTVMPILTKFAEGLRKVANVTKEFFQGLMGTDKQKKTKSQTKQVTAQANAYTGLSNSIKSAGKAAGNSLATFDKINVFNKNGSGAIDLSIVPNVKLDETNVLTDSNKKVTELVKKIEKQTPAQKLGAWIRAAFTYSTDEKREVENKTKALKQFQKDFDARMPKTPMNMSIDTSIKLQSSKTAFAKKVEELAGKISNWFKETWTKFWSGKGLETTLSVTSGYDWINGNKTQNTNYPANVTVPKMATGGIVNGATLAMIGEAGKEAVVPLENNTEWIDKLAAKIGGTSNPIQIIFGSKTIANITQSELNRQNRMAGRTVITI